MQGMKFAVNQLINKRNALNAAIELGFPWKMEILLTR